MPLTRFIDARNHLDILANGIIFTRNRARQLIEQYLGKLGCCGRRAPAGEACRPEATAPNVTAARRPRPAWRPSSSPAPWPSSSRRPDVFRITITSFLDAYNFDVRRVMKCCIHHVLPSGHVIPFCAYNVLYRDGHVVLPALRDAGVSHDQAAGHPCSERSRSDHTKDSPGHWGTWRWRRPSSIGGLLKWARTCRGPIPLIMLASMAVGVVLSRRTQPRSGLAPDQRLGIGLGAFCGAMIGAKLPFVLADWEGLLSGRAWFDNGKTIVFGLVGGYFGVELAKAMLGVRVKTGDTFAVPVAAAIAVGRLGCFVARLLPWGRDDAPLGRRLRRRPPPPSDPALRVRLPPDRRLGPGRPEAPGPVPRSAHQALHHRLPVVSVPHRVHPSRAGPVTRADRLPVGVPGDCADLRRTLGERLAGPRFPGWT